MNHKLLQYTEEKKTEEGREYNMVVKHAHVYDSVIGLYTVES